MQIICNIPHAGTDIPSWAIQDFVINEIELKRLTNRLVDISVDRLFSFVATDDKVVLNVSRIVVDMERYRDDNEEPMAKLGMGLFYEKDDVGNVIRHKGTTYNKCLKLYDNYHAKLESKVTKSVEETGSCYIIDCHSFHDKMNYTGHDITEFPDVCLGINDDIPSKEVIWIKELFENNGYSVEYNIPFKGSIVPLKYLNDARVKSIMLELNRRIYCNNQDDFQKVQDLCREVCDYLKNVC